MAESNEREDDLEQILEIRDPQIDAEAVMRQIREAIRKRRAQAEAQGVDYESFVEGLYTSQDSARFDGQVYYDLRRMSLSYNKIGVGLSLTANRLPIIGGMMQRVRAALHHLVLYYVNMMAGQQVAFNEYALRALSALVKDLDSEPRGEAQALREQVAALEARVQQLEAALAKEPQNRPS